VQIEASAKKVTKKRVGDDKAIGDTGSIKADEQGAKKRTVRKMGGAPKERESRQWGRKKLFRKLLGRGEGKRTRRGRRKLVTSGKSHPSR